MAQARIIDGKAFAAGLRARIAEEVSAIKAQGLTPGLAVVLVGEDPASQVYVRNKGEQTEAAGMHSETHRLAAETSQEALETLVRRLNADPKIHGILVQLPLPAHLNASEVLAAIDPDKDVDGLTVINAGRLAAGLPGLFPCTPLGCVMLLEDALGSLRGKHAVVIGRSNLVGKPMALLLTARSATVTVAHSKTRDLQELCRTADILVAAVGRPEMIRGDWIKPGAAVIDVGINRTDAGLRGDVAGDEAREVAGWLTPVPGGVGPMTIAYLLANTLEAARRRAAGNKPTGDD